MSQPKLWIRRNCDESSGLAALCGNQGCQPFQTKNVPNILPRKYTPRKITAWKSRKPSVSSLRNLWTRRQQCSGLDSLPLQKTRTDFVQRPGALIRRLNSSGGNLLIFYYIESDYHLIKSAGWVPPQREVKQNKTGWVWEYGSHPKVNLWSQSTL